MAIFANLDIESGIQLNDKTRFDASKCFVTKGATAISTLTVTPGVGVTPISVYDTDTSQRFLDWEFLTFNIDIDATNNKIDFKESASALVATLTSGTYTLATLATEIKTQLDASGLNTYTVTVSADDKMTIAADGGFSLLYDEATNKLTSLLPTLKFFRDQTGAVTYESAERIDALVKKVTVTAGDGATTTSKNYYIKLYSVLGDALFSTDGDLRKHEPDIFRWVPQGRATFNDTHRRSQELILSWLDEQGYVDIYGNKFTKEDIVDRDEVKQWSIFMTLRLIFEGISNDIDDVFDRKAKSYLELEKVARNRAVIRIDIDNDKVVNNFETIEVQPALVLRR